MISVENDLGLFDKPGFNDLIACITIAEGQANAAKDFTDIAKREARVAAQEATIMREVSATMAATIRKAFEVAAVA